MILRQAEWLEKGTYATNKKGDIFFRWDSKDQNLIMLPKTKTSWDGQYVVKRFGKSKEETNLYITVPIGSKYIMAHKIIARNYPEICGEWFEGAVVHHINGIKSDNRPQNLLVMSKKEHNKWHTNTPIIFKGIEYNSFIECTMCTKIGYPKLITNPELAIIGEIPDRIIP